jgi:HlyD family secretion protein
VLAQLKGLVGTPRRAGVSLLGAVALALLVYWYVVPVEVPHYDMKAQLAGREITGPGVLDANQKVIVAARIQAFLAEILVDRNAMVKKGELLARLDDKELRHQLAASLATKNAAEQAIQEAELELRRSDIALVRTKQAYERQLALIKNNTVTQAQFDQAKSDFNQAEAAQVKARVSIERAKAMAQSSAAEVQVLESRLAETKIRSPINGVVVARSRSMGDLLSPGIELMSVVDPESLRLFARFDESTIDSLKPGQLATTRFSSDPNQPHPGKVERIIRQVDQETREFTAEIALDILPPNWAVGQRGVVTVQAESPSPRLVVPQRLLTRRGGVLGVWVNSNGRAIWRQVAVGFPTGGNIEVTRGLSQGDAVLEPARRYAYQSVTRPAP